MIMAAIHLNKEGFDKAMAQGGVALVDFWATWCGPCKMLAPAIEALSDQYDGKALVGKVDVDDQPELAAQFGVMSIPTVILFKDGKEVSRTVGVQPPTVFEDLLDNNL
jgi:thioredoxin 1